MRIETLSPLLPRTVFLETFEGGLEETLRKRDDEVTLVGFGSSERDYVDTGIDETSILPDADALLTNLGVLLFCFVDEAS